MNKNNILTKFDEGGLHENNPNGGVMIGNNNSVEQGETKSGNFVYSNRIFLDSNIVSQYNLPKSLIGKSVADATKFIDNKFKGRNDKISQSTKNGMLSKIAEAQEAMKPQEPEMEQSQMALGGFAGSTIGQGFGAEATGAQQSQAIGAGLGVVTTALDLGNVAFGKPTQNTDGLAASAPVDKVGMIGGSALKGASAGMAFGPWGAGIGAVVGAGAGLLGSKKAEKAAIENTNNFALNTNKQFSDKYALGGEIDPPTKITVDNLINTPIVTGVKPVSQSDRFRYAVGEQSGVQHGTSGEQGHYLYYGKKPGDSGFNPSIHREFVNQGGYDTYMKSPQGQQYRRNLSTQSLQPIEQFGYGGNMNKYGGGGVLPKPPTADYDTNIIKNLHDSIGITPDMPGYGTAWGKKSNDFFGKKIGGKGYNYTKEDILKLPYSKDLQTKLGITVDGYKYNPLPIEPVTVGDPVITPTQTKAGFEAYPNGYYENLKLTPRNTAPIESILETSGLKPVGTTVPYTIGTQPAVDISNANRQFTSGPSFGRRVWEGTKDTGKFINKNAGNIARYAPIAANALQLAQLKKPQGERLDRLDNRYRPEYVDEAQLQNIANQTMNNSVNAIGQSGASQGQLRSSIIGSQLQRTKAISDAYSQAAAQNRQQNAMAQEFNLGVDQTNLGQSTLEKDINARNQGAYDTEKSKLIGKIGENIGNVGNEQAYKKIAITTTGYNWLAEYQKANPTATAEEAVTAAKKAGVIVDDTKTTKKNALGGYLIKNKVK